MIVMRGYLGGDADYLCRRSSVIVVAPALGATPVWQKAGARGPERFSDTASGEAFRAARERILAEGPKGLSPQAVAETVWTALTARRPELRYAPARRPILDERLAHVLPRPRVDRVHARRLGPRPDARVGADAAHPPCSSSPEPRLRPRPGSAGVLNGATPASSRPRPPAVTATAVAPGSPAGLAGHHPPERNGCRRSGVGGTPWRGAGLARRFDGPDALRSARRYGRDACHDRRDAPAPRPAARTRPLPPPPRARSPAPP
jgi:hypothetical protein